MKRRAECYADSTDVQSMKPLMKRLRREDAVICWLILTTCVGTWAVMHIYRPSGASLAGSLSARRFVLLGGIHALTHIIWPFALLYLVCLAVTVPRPPSTGAKDRSAH